MTEDTSIILFAAYSLKTIPRELLNEEVYSNVENVFKNHVSSEVDNVLNYDFRLNRDLMIMNDTDEETLFFEIPSRQLIEADYKEMILKQWIPRELDLIREASSSL